MIVMSSVPNHARLEEAIRKGARDYILKPVDADILLEKCLRHFEGVHRASHVHSRELRNYVALGR